MLFFFIFIWNTVAYEYNSGMSILRKFTEFRKIQFASSVLR